jgi:retinol dehydrogenase 12
VNHLSAMLLTILLFPCLLKAVSSGTSPNPRVVLVSSEAHYWAKFTEAEVESDKILQKLSDKDYCTPQWGIPFFASGGSRNIILLGSCVKDTPYRNVGNNYFSRGVLNYGFLVLNIFSVRELTKRLPANSPVILTAVNPGYCKSQLGRYLSPVHRILGKIMEALLARTTEEGSRQLVWAAVGGAGREFELRGGYVDMANLQEVSDYALSDEGAAVQTRLWVRDTFSHNWTC